MVGTVRRWRWAPSAFAAFVVAILSFPFDLSSQPPRVVVIEVSTETGVPISFARVRIVGLRVDTTLRAGSDGVAQFRTAIRELSLSTTMIGYAADNRSVSIPDTGQVRIEVRLRRTPQLLDAREISARWIGISGVVGDVSLEHLLDDVTIRAMSGTWVVKTDSVGRFSVRTDRIGDAILTFEKKGYLRRQAAVQIDSANNPEITVLLRPGTERNSKATDQRELTERLRDLRTNGAVLTHDDLFRTGEGSLEDAIVRAGIFGKNSMLWGPSVCVFVDGEPQPRLKLNDVRVRQVEFVEIWRRDFTGTMGKRWPRPPFGACSQTKHGSAGGTVRWVGVWLRK